MDDKMPEEDNKKGNGKSNGKNAANAANAANGTNGTKDIKELSSKTKKDISYTEYYKIRTGIELHRRQLKKHLEELEQLAKRKGIPLPDEILAHQQSQEAAGEAGAGGAGEAGQAGTPAEKSRKTRIIEAGIIALIFIVVLGAIAYITLASLYPNWLPFSTTGYSIMAGDSKILQSGISEFYIDDTSVLGNKQTYQGRTIRPITSSKKFNFVFKPARTITKTAGTLKLNLVMLNNSNIYLNDQLIFPNLDNYEFIKETNDGYNIYIRKDIIENIDMGEGLKDGDSATQFIYNNFPSSSVWSTSKLESINPAIEGYKQEETLINTTFRGSLKLVVYAKDTLNIKMTKQDLNSYLGADEYTVNITNYRGEVIYTGLLEDDGVKEAGKGLGEEQPFEINKEVEEGVYYVEFIEGKDNIYSDVSIKKIRINSNKILIIGTSLPIEPFSFYTKNARQETLGFLYWHTGKEQTITISVDENKIIDLNESWISKTYQYNLTAGEHSVELEKGDLWVYANVISPSKENWFNFPPIISENYKNQDILVIDSYTYDKDNRIFYYEKDVEVKGGDKFSFRALEEGAVGLESINLEMK